MTKLEKLAGEYMKVFGITPEQWTSNKRFAEIMHAQRAFAQQARTMGYTWREIARACGKSTHSTMIKMCQQKGWREKNILAEEEKRHDNNKRRI